MNTNVFDDELSRGLVAYNEGLGHWWLGQAADASHRYAYRNIADYIHASLRREPRLIVDYACGSGNLLSLLSTRFPSSCLMGLDGSLLLLNIARRRLARRGRSAVDRIVLMETPLPSFDLSPMGADLVVFTFPNMVPSSNEGFVPEIGPQIKPVDRAAAHFLAGMSDPASEAMAENAEDLRFSMLRDRWISLNLHGLLKRGGICVRVEYAKFRRHEISRLGLMRVAFGEGSLDMAVNGKLPKQWFRVLASAYHRSHVTDDVYHQSGNADDRGGGYVITVLRAL